MVFSEVECLIVIKLYKKMPKVIMLYFNYRRYFAALWSRESRIWSFDFLSLYDYDIEIDAGVEACFDFRVLPSTFAKSLHVIQKKLGPNYFFWSGFILPPSSYLYPKNDSGSNQVLKTADKSRRIGLFQKCITAFEKIFWFWVPTNF